MEDVFKLQKKDRSVLCVALTGHSQCKYISSSTWPAEQNHTADTVKEI